MSYAEGTTVSPEKSRMEIEQTLTRYGASAFGYMNSENGSAVVFKVNGRSIKIVIAHQPCPFNVGEWRSRRGYAKESDVAAWIEQDKRRRWRALLLVIKAKLEAVESKIATFDDEFLAYVVMPNGQTMGEWMAPQIASAIEHGQMPKLLLGAGANE